MFLIRKVLKQESWLERDGSSVSQGLLVAKVTLEIGDHGKGSLPIEKVRNFREFSRKGGGESKEGHFPDFFKTA